MKISKEKFFSMLEKGNVKNFKIGNIKFYSRQISEDVTSYLSKLLKDKNRVLVYEVESYDESQFFLIFHHENINVYLVHLGADYGEYGGPSVSVEPLKSERKREYADIYLSTENLDKPLLDQIKIIKTLAKKNKILPAIVGRAIFEG